MIVAALGSKAHASVGTDAILYELDPAYRRRARQREVTKDPSFGGALRRLRLQEGLGRGDFGKVSDKTIARIERGEVGKPHARTLAAIARRLGGAPDEIRTF
ncbi:MAG: helix-turn-helix domain-containing protein [Deltaproteobacteria bacterium]|nr:helix-turn-helix domain-containing protein [Deltaproteobacteria bacterium]